MMPSEPDTLLLEARAPGSKTGLGGGNYEPSLDGVFPSRAELYQFCLSWPVLTALAFGAATWWAIITLILRALS